MYDHRHARHPGSAATERAASVPEVGRTTRVQQLAEPPARLPLFAGDPQWEMIDAAEATAPPWPSASPAGTPASGAGADAVEHDVEAAMPSEEPSDAMHVAGGGEPAASHDAHGADHAAHAAEASDSGGHGSSHKSHKPHKPHDPLHVGHHSNPHAGPFERELAGKGDHHRAARDAYNRKSVRADRGTAHVFGRPGVVSHGHGIFQLKSDTNRYTFTGKGKVNVAVPFDRVFANTLLTLNPKGTNLTEEQKQQIKDEMDQGRVHRLALNRSFPRRLEINGREELCVLSWLGGAGSAWIPVSQLVGDTHQIVADTRREAHESDPSHKMHASSHYIIREDAVSQADDQDKGKGLGPNAPSHPRVLAPHTKSGDDVMDYLEKDLDKPAFDAKGNLQFDDKGQLKTVQRGFVAICMNLPEGHGAVVAVDTGLAGDSFFAFNDKRFHRELAVYENNAGLSHRRQKWVFGHLGKHKGSGKHPKAMVPDPRRAGWVPLRVLKLP